MTERGADRLELLLFLRSVLQEPLPEDLVDEHDEVVIAARLRQIAGSDEWIARASEHEGWIGHAMQRGGELEHAQRLVQPFHSLFDALSTSAALLGMCCGLTHLALDQHVALEPDVRELFDDALRDAAAGGARAWARIAQARCLLATIDEATP